MDIPKPRFSPEGNNITFEWPSSQAKASISSILSPDYSTMKAILSMFLRSLAICLAAGTLIGCLKEEADMVILPDGAGRIDVEVEFGKKLSDGIREELAKGRELVDECRRSFAGNWKGIAFWTDEVAEDKLDENSGEKRIHYRGSCWFEDASMVSLIDKQQWKWKSRAAADDDNSVKDVGGFEFEFVFDPLPKPDGGKTRAEQVEEAREALEGFEVSFRFRLPGLVTEISGAGASEGREVTFKLTAEDLLAGAQMEEEERGQKYHHLIVKTGPPIAEAKVAQAAFHRAWAAMQKVGIPHAKATAGRPAEKPAPPPIPLSPPLTLAEVNQFYAVPETDPDWKLTMTSKDELSEWWSGSIRGSRKERIPLIVRVPREGRPCPVVVKQHTWHGTKESGQETGLPVIKQGVAVISFDGPLVGSREIEGRDPLGESPELGVDNHRWAVSDLRTVIRALSLAPLADETVTTKKGVVVVGVSLGGPTAITAFALELNAAAGATVVAGAGAWSAARDQEQPGTSFEGAGDIRLRKTAETQRVAALLDPAMILPLVKPRPIAIVGGAEDGLAPETGLRRLARSVEAWPEVFLRVHPEVGHFITEPQAKEVTAWIVEHAKALR
ncbi:MAG: pimeloyl-ACP methyl ester carboxylesterase [Verrucomicrobiales bacterium]|jgi:pimeloyl-ACP methyl ester carboxylesterase